MTYTLNQVLKDRDLRRALAESTFVFVDNNNVFELDFQEQSLLKNHRETFDRLCELGGEALLGKLLAEGNTCLTDDPNAAKQGVRRIQGTERFFLKTNAGAPTALASIFFGIAGWAETAPEFDADMVTIQTEYETDNLVLDLDAADDLLLEWPAMNGSIVQKDGKYAIYDNGQDKIVALPFVDVADDMLSTMVICELVNAEHPEYGWKFKVSEDKNAKWGWLHSEFRQAVSPQFDVFYQLTEDSTDVFAAAGFEDDDIMGTLWVFQQPEGRYPLLSQLGLPSTALKRPSLDKMGFESFHRLLREDRILDGRWCSCVLLSSWNNYHCANHYYWEISLDGTSELFDLICMGSQYTRHKKPSDKKIGCVTQKVEAHQHISFGLPNHQLSLDFCRYAKEFDGPLAYHSFFSIPGENGKQISLHAVCQKSDEHLLALAGEECNGIDFDRWNVGTPYAFTNFSEVYHDDEYAYVVADQLGKKGLIKVYYHYGFSFNYIIPCDYEKINVSEEGITVHRMGFVGKLDLDGKWVEHLHREEQ